jgi:hypothetical protein
VIGQSRQLGGVNILDNPIASLSIKRIASGNGKSNRDDYK